MSELIFNQSPEIKIATNTFINVPIILKYGDINLIEVVKGLKMDYTTKISIFHSDGTSLGVAYNSRFFRTEEGEKAGVIVDMHPNLWVCKLNGRELFEIRQEKPNLFKITAELYTNDGAFIKIDENPSINITRNNLLSVINQMMTNCIISDVNVAIMINKK